MDLPKKKKPGPKASIGRSKISSPLGQTVPGCLPARPGDSETTVTALKEHGVWWTKEVNGQWDKVQVWPGLALEDGETQS